MFTLIEKAAFAPAVILLSAALFSLHFGASEFISVQFILFLAVYLYFLSAWLLRLEHAVVFIVVSLIIAAGVFLSSQESHFYLVGLRNAAVISIVYVIARHVNFYPYGDAYSATIRGALTVVLLGNLMLATLQLVDVMLLHTGLFYIARDFFALNYGTLQSEIPVHILEAGYFARPSGFYSEPSALAAIGLVGMFVGNYCADRRLYFVALSVIAISASLSGLIFACLFSLVFTLQRSGLFQDRNFRLFSLVSLLVVFLVGVVLVGDRIGPVLSGEDISASVRVYEPLRIIGALAADGRLLGASQSELLEKSAATVTTIFDNWFLSQLMMYGLIGILLIAFIFLIFGPALWPLLVAFGVMNGDMFYYDRMVLLLVAIIAIRARGQTAANIPSAKLSVKA